MEDHMAVRKRASIAVWICLAAAPSVWSSGNEHILKCYDGLAKKSKDVITVNVTLAYSNRFATVADGTQRAIVGGVKGNLRIVSIDGAPIEKFLKPGQRIDAITTYVLPSGAHELKVTHESTATATEVHAMTELEQASLRMRLEYEIRSKTKAENLSVKIEVPDSRRYALTIATSQPEPVTIQLESAKSGATLQFGAMLSYDGIEFGLLKFKTDAASRVLLGSLGSRLVRGRPVIDVQLAKSPVAVTVITREASDSLGSIGIE